MPMKKLARILRLLPGTLACLLAGHRACAADTSSTARPGGFQFDGKISRPVLENYLSRSVSMEGLLNGRGDLKDNIRMLKSEGAKYIGRALCLWGAERDFTNSVERARKQIPEVLAADPEMVLEACVFEIVGQRVSQIPIPGWVFTAFGQPVTNRNFIYENMIYPANARRSMSGGQVPDESQLETRMWFYYQAASYIDIGCEAIHFGQVEIMNRNDKANAHWEELLTMVRQYAAKHARRHMVLCNGHTPSGGLQRNGNPLLDFNAFPLRIMESTNAPMEAILKVGYSDGIYGHSKGGKTFSGWTCEHLPYLVELDNFGASRHQGQPGGPNERLYVWGYDEITWFAHQTREYRAKWLQYAWDWLRDTDADAHLQMPGSRTATSSDTRWYFAKRGPERPRRRGCHPRGLGQRYGQVILLAVKHHEGTVPGHH